MQKGSGWHEKVLRVNLTQRKASVEELDLNSARDFIGCRGLAAKYLYDEVDPKVDAYSPENKLIFATGPLTGTRAPAGNRYMVVTKSPLTGAIANSSAGGYFPSELKFAGYDLIIFEGKSEVPVYLWIDDEETEIRDATKFWGKNTIETAALICDETDAQARVACIGPAGEKLIRFACIMNEGRTAGRSGVGAVMGSKNLKAVAVRGTKSVPIFSEDGFKEAAKKATGIVRADKEVVGELGITGTPGVMAMVNEFGALPTRNWRTSTFEGVSKIDGEAYHAPLPSGICKWGKGRGRTCRGCPLGCGRETVVTEPKEFAGEGHGPEYETLGVFGSNCGVDDLHAIAKANYICNELGMDTISCGSTIACAADMFEHGILSKGDVGVELRFGNASAMVEMVRRIGNREAFGDVLAEGSYRLCEKYGHLEFFRGSKKQEMSSYEPRAMQGSALAFATDNRGADHIRNEVNNVELYGINVQLYGFNDVSEVEPDLVNGKAKLCKAVQDHYAVIDSSGLCNFICLVLPYEVLASLLDTATGFNYGVEGMLKAGERVFNIERLFNLKAGLTGKDDTYPGGYWLKVPLPDGAHKGHVAELDKMLPEYYKLRGWDSEGVPLPEKLKELSLSF